MGAPPATRHAAHMKGGGVEMIAELYYPFYYFTLFYFTPFYSILLQYCIALVHHRRKRIKCSKPRWTHASHAQQQLRVAGAILLLT